MKKFLVVLGVLASTLTGPALATQTWDDVTARTAMDALATAPPTSGVRVAYLRSPWPADTAAPPFIVNFISAGYDQTGVPCINCVVGGATPNLGLPAPFNFVNPGITMQYLLSSSINSASGTCTAAVSVAAGKTTLYAASETTSGLTGSPGTIELPFTQPPTTYTQSWLGNSPATARPAWSRRRSSSTETPADFGPGLISNSAWRLPNRHFPQ